MKIPVGDFGFATPDRAPRPDIPLGPQPGRGLAELGATGMRIANDFAKADEVNAHMAYGEAHEQRLAAEHESRNAAHAKAGAVFTTFKEDVFDLQKGLVERLNRGELTRDLVPDEYAAGVNALKKQHRESVPEPLRGEVDNHMQDYEFSQRRALEQELSHHRRDEVVAATMRIREALERRSERDLPGAQESWNTYVDAIVVPQLGQAKGEEMKQAFGERSTLRNIEARMQAAGQSRDVGTLAALEKEISGNDTLDLGQKTRLLERLATNTVRAQAENASDLEIAVHRGSAGYRQVENAFRSGVITPAKRTELTTYLITKDRKEQEQQQLQRQAINAVELARAGVSVLDFRSKPDRDAVDYHYEAAFLPALERQGITPATDPDRFKAEVVNYVARIGIMPDKVRADIRGSLRAGDPAAKASAADFLDRLKTANPQVLNDFADEDIRVANTIGSYVRAGVEPLKAVDLAQKSLDVSPAEREVREKRYAELQKKDAATRNAKFLKDQLVGWRLIGSKPTEVPDALAGEFEDLVRGEYIRTGDVQAAQGTAVDQVRKLWGVTHASSDGKARYMKYAPELVYHVDGVDPGWVREQLLKEAPKNAFSDEKQDLLLGADSLTAREQRPSYPIFTRRNGVLEPVWGDDGRQVRFRPDFATSPAGGRLRKAFDEQKAEGLKILERERARRAGTIEPPPEPVLAP